MFPKLAAGRSAAFGRPSNSPVAKLKALVRAAQQEPSGASGAPNECRDYFFFAVGHDDRKML